MTTLPPTVGAVILAAGRGTRLNCLDRPKVMLPIGGRPMVSYTVEHLEKAGLPKRHISLVVGFRADQVKNYFGADYTYAWQVQQRGTADAGYVGMRVLPESVEHVLVVGGDDSAFYRPETFRWLIDEHDKSGSVLTLLTTRVSDPEQLGRIVRHSDGRVEIIEKEYLTEEQKRIGEVSTGTFVFDRRWFENIFPAMPPLRKLGEYGLPTALALAQAQGKPCQVLTLAEGNEWFGVNTPDELAEADRRKRDLPSLFL